MKEWLRNLDEAAKEAARQMGTELKHMGAHGSHEVAATLFNGSAFVMYPRGRHDDGVQGVPEQAQSLPERPQIEHGRDM